MLIPMADIFISYASPDKESAKALTERLAERGHSVWWDRTIPPGRVFDEVIQEALHEAKCVVVLWSTASVNSNWVKTEASEAVGQYKLVPALIEAVPPPIEFKRIQAADLSGWSGEADHPEYLKLVSAVEQLLKNPPSAAASRPLPQAPAPVAKAGATSKRAALKIVALVGAIGLVAIFAVRWTAQTAPTRVQPPPTPQARVAPEAAGGTPAAAAPAAAAPTAPAPSALGADAAAQRPAPGRRTNLLSPAEGGEIVTASHERWTLVVDGKEDTYAWVDAGEAVFAFKNGRAATFDTFAVLIPSTSDTNLRDFELLVANDPGGAYQSIGMFSTQNMRIMRNPYQEFRFAPVKAKYLKVRALKNHSGNAGAATGYEFQLYGSVE